MNVSSNTALQTINFSGNLFTQADLSKNTALTTVYCQGNRLTSLDLSKHTHLSYLNCSNNALQVLNLKNGNNTNMTYFDARTNSKLSCIEVDNVSYSTTNWTNKDAGASYNTTCTACNVNIPDANLKSALLNISGIDISGDAVIQCYEAAAYTGEIDVSGANIANMTGIEAFTNATLLNCSYNLLTSLNVTSNTALQTLYCSNNTIDNLNITGLSSLSNIDCSTNNFTSLNFSGIGLTSLTQIYCNDNVLTTLNVSGLTNLTDLYCQRNKLSSLNLISNAALVYLCCNNNLLTTLNVSGLVHLSLVECSYNKLASLDFSTNTLLQELYCNYNSLTSLNVKNGNNTNISASNFNATNNADLTCIQVDDAAYSTANWTSKDDGASYNTSCGTVTEISEIGKVAWSVYPNPSNGLVNFRFTPENQGKTTIDIFSVTGELMYRVFEGALESGIEKTIQFTKPLTEGLYIYKMTNGSDIKTGRLIRMKGNN